MYDFIEGRLSERRPARLVVETAGVGYDLTVPLGVDFPERALREVFRLLLEVRGVGPAVALAVLSTLPGEELLRAVAGQDAAPLLRVKGVGKKTAEQILLDLREKAPRMLAESVRDTLVPRAPAAKPSLEDAVRALVSIGYSDKEARKSVERASAKVQGDDLELLVRTALQQ